MRLVEYLIYLLEAQAQTLHRLAALLGEDELLEILENSGETFEPKARSGVESPPSVFINPKSFDAPGPGATASPYQELEGAVHEFKLAAPLEFHLWAYSHYRAFIESAVDLNARIQGAGAEQGTALVEEAVAHAEEWIRHLHLPPAVSLQAERAAHVPWLRFRTTVLRRIGKRPMGPVC